jgi:hypothetical protein
VSVFTLAEFAQRHPPHVIGNLRDAPDMFGCDAYALRILDLPIGLPSARRWYLPDYAERFQPFIECCASAMPGRRLGRYVYLTVDQGLVKRGTFQRVSGCHVDGFQGVRVNPKVETDISFVVSNTLPTVFYPEQTWDVTGLDPATDDFFAVFAKQADEDRAWRPEPYQVVECSAYTVHRADVAPRDLVRTFLRLTYSVREFDRFGNSINPLLGKLWEYHSRETPTQFTHGLIA